MGVIRRLRPLARFGLLVLVLTFAAVWVQEARMMARHLDGQSLTGTADAALVLGAGIQADGVLSFEGRRRVIAGVKLYRAGKVTRLIMSDGSARQFDVDVSGAMKDYAVGAGVPTEAILEDRLARTTFDTARLAGPLIAEHGVASLVLVTDGYHLTRARLLAGMFDLPVVGLAASDAHTHLVMVRRVLSLGRETLSWWYNAYKIAAWHVLGWIGWDETRRAAHIY